jgi:isoquinoline 1-oxidoreductase subunit beta
MNDVASAGETGAPPTSAANCNVIFNAAGTRIRAMPVDTSLLKRA